LKSNPPDPSRRRALKAMAVVVVGGCAALLGSGLISLPRPEIGSQYEANVESHSSVTGTGNGQTAYARIKVRYFQMSSTLPGVTEEYFDLPSPAVYGQLRAAVIASHPVLASMVPNMLVLVDGVVAKSDTPLQDGDEVDLVPTMAGG